MAKEKNPVGEEQNVDMPEEVSGDIVDKEGNEYSRDKATEILVPKSKEKAPDINLPKPPAPVGKLHVKEVSKDVAVVVDDQGREIRVYNSKDGIKDPKGAAELYVKTH
ncbi:MAG TPA: hypothetical protein PKZ42_01760 [Syntrophales bacterium]|nr:hypothetical protein [Syntrophales bacterium]